MERPRDSMASILNNDDNPSFFVPSSRPVKSRSPVSTSRQPLHLWPASSSGSITRDFAAASPGSATFHHRDLMSSHPAPLTPSPEPPGYYSNQASQARSAGSYSSSASTTTSDRLSIRSITRPHGSQPEPLSPQSSRSSTGDLAAPKISKKNKYPCPYAASHGCTATFTTSGHAARHGKKHTGEKSVHCPICNKAFTRKDNMKQHKRTHRSSGAAADDELRPQTTTSSSSKWDLSQSDTDNVPPTPTSDRPPSNRSDLDMMGADDVVGGRITKGEGMKRPHSSSPRSAHRSR